jgi:hypothetical protein
LQGAFESSTPELSHANARLIFRGPKMLEPDRKIDFAIAEDLSIANSPNVPFHARFLLAFLLNKVLWPSNNREFCVAREQSQTALDQDGPNMCPLAHLLEHVLCENAQNLSMPQKLLCYAKPNAMRTKRTLPLPGLS